MFELDKELIVEFVAESLESLATVESDLLAIEAGGASLDLERVNRVFRAIHTMKGASGLFNLTKIGTLAHETENVLALIRSKKLAVTPDHIHVLLSAVDRLCEMFRNAGTSNQAGIEEVTAELADLCPNRRKLVAKVDPNDDNQPQPDSSHLRMLLVEDDFACRLLLQTFLSRYGLCHVVVNGREAIEAFRLALESGRPYDLICMDIMMPEMDGREAVRQIRALEEGRGIRSTTGAKIIMTTTVQEVKEVFHCFNELCDSYLIKPIDLGQLLGSMESLQLL